MEVNSTPIAGPEQGSSQRDDAAVDTVGADAVGTDSVGAHEPDLCFAVTVARTGADWTVTPIEGCYERINAGIAAVQQLQSNGPAFAMLCVDDEYFVIIRPTPARTHFLISDATMAVGDELASSVLDVMGAPAPVLEETMADSIDRLEPWAEGDFNILADLGVSEQVMSVICDDSELWASEQLLRIAAEIGFEAELAKAADLDLD